MGIEPYQLTSSIHGIVAQRLIRRKAPGGYRGRVPVAEFVTMDASLKKAVMDRGDAAVFTKIYQTQPGYQRMQKVGQALIEKGITDETELKRVIDPSK
jgi:type II secretory ATPase GspE/PulE/Tfp pilus assembly ATPase PilB-like protein